MVRGQRSCSAGAGSGKTRVLTTRIAWLIQNGHVTPGGVLAVTFTNKAAREMLTRLTAMLPVNPRGLWIGTFHGLANRLLRTTNQEAGLPREFQILDTQDQLSAVKRLARALNIDEDRLPPRDLQRFINSQKEEGLRGRATCRGRRPDAPAGGVLRRLRRAVPARGRGGFRGTAVAEFRVCWAE
jgi:DNA helicase-2/ATP-dependent DNA helicase PcrA